MPGASQLIYSRYSVGYAAGCKPLGHDQPKKFTEAGHTSTSRLWYLRLAESPNVVLAVHIRGKPDCDRRKAFASGLMIDTGRRERQR
jgi:hypothetical protein